MNLEFIWIEEFRNFKLQGFSFSQTRDYSVRTNLENGFVYGENAEISVNLKESQELPIFPKNVCGVTGVIGKNGTGKSNLLDLIALLMKGGKTSIQGHFIIVMRDQDRAIAYHNFETMTTTSSNVDFRKYNQRISNLNVAYFSNIIDGRETKFNREVADLTANKRNRSGWRRGEEITAQLNFINSKIYNEFDIEAPKRISISPRYINHIHLSTFAEKSRYHDVLARLLEIVNSRLSRSSEKVAFVSLFRVSFFIEVFEKLFDSLVPTANGFESWDNSKLEVLIGKFKSENISNNTIQEIGRLALETCGELFSLDWVFYDDPEAFNKFHETEEKIKKLTIKYSSEGKKERAKKIFVLDFDGPAKSFLRSYLKNLETTNILFLEWAGISSGHKAYLNLFSLFHSKQDKFQNHPTLVCIDEGDLYLHPQWQKEYLSMVLKYLPIIIKGKIQLFISSHSPFIASDLPKSNLLFLDRIENGEALVLKSTDIIGETFAANIQDLFINSFFIQNSTMGEFAFKTLQDVILSIKGQSTKYTIDESKIIISKIGDSMIKKQLENMISE